MNWAKRMVAVKADHLAGLTVVLMVGSLADQRDAHSVELKVGQSDEKKAFLLVEKWDGLMAD